MVEEVNDEAWLWPTRIAVGSDGTVFVAGAQRNIGTSPMRAMVQALVDEGDGASPLWDPVEVDDNGGYLVYGLGLREVGGESTALIVNSGNTTVLGTHPRGGQMVALDPSSGELLWDAAFDPEDHGFHGSLHGVAIGADGALYTQISGRDKGGTVLAVDGDDGSLLWALGVEGHLDWASPVIGPDGSLYFGDSRRCTWSTFPIEDGRCDNVDQDPVMFRVPPEGTSAASGVDNSEGCGGCSGGGSAGVWPFGLLVLLRRRRAT